MKRLSICVAGLVTVLGNMPWAARAGGEEVVVVYNAAMPESQAVAAYYARRRGVPARQVFGFKLSTGGDMSRAEYREALLTPLVRELTQAGLARFGPVRVPETNGQERTERRLVEARFRYAVLCYGVPWRIKPDAGLYEPDTETLRPELRRNEAAVDSELACLAVCERPYTLAGPLSNPFYGTTNAAALHPTNGVLMVARLDGPTPAVARRLVDSALEAEHDGMWGRAYFDLRGTVDAGLQSGEDQLRAAAEICRHLGLETVVDTNEAVFPAGFPMSQIAFYAGWYREHATGALGLPKVEFMPGAFAYHLHSFSAANLRSTAENWVGPLLDRGVTITLGSVYEPYLGGTPDLSVFAGRLIFFGFSFGEAAYAGLSTLSWQTTVVGDPLYRPFGSSPSKLHDQLERRGSPLVAWSHLRLVNLNLARGVPVAEMVGYLESKDITRTSAVLMEKLGDLYQAQGKPSSAVYAHQRALELARSAPQRMRLSLGLTDKLAALDRGEEAWALAQKFLKDFPDYPDKPAVYRRLIALAEKLGKADERERYQRELNALVGPPTAPPSAGKSGK